KVYGSRKKKGVQFIEIEAQDYQDVWDGIKLRADVIMLDNMPPARLRRSVYFIRAARRALNSSTPLIELSGGITIKKAKQLSQMGVARISVGALTHSAPALDLSMEGY
ncbi:hypothetical protein BVX98_00465, partial [bacterium F11]